MSRPDCIAQLEASLRQQLPDLALSEQAVPEHDPRRFQPAQANTYALDAQGRVMALAIRHQEGLKTLHLPAEGFEQLAALHLSDNALEQVVLPALPRLQHLDLCRNALQDLRFSAPLPQLQFLDASYNRAAWPRLHFPKGFDRLEYLYVYNSQLQEIAFEAAIPLLEELHLGKNSLKRLDLPDGFGRLVTLRLASNGLRQFVFDWRQLDQLEVLELQNNDLHNLDTTLCETQENCRDALWSYFNDLGEDFIKVHQSKIIVIGNGRVGKTTLVKRWIDGTYVAGESSTHGIQLRRVPQKDWAAQFGLDYLFLNIWDFGGQDIYHSTHRLFMRTRAIFVLAWDRLTEQEPVQYEELDAHTTVAYRNYPLPYWLSYAHVLGQHSPVLVVQTKINQPGCKERPPACLEQVEQLGYQVRRYLGVESGKPPVGIKAFDEQVWLLVEEQLSQRNPNWPLPWWEIQQDLEARPERGEKLLPLEAFKTLCAEKGLDARSTSTLLDYLHHTGSLFYRPGLFGNLMVLDQKWAIEAVYALFNRKAPSGSSKHSMFSKLISKGLGQFTGEDLIDAWDQVRDEAGKPRYEKSEQELLLSFMTSCEICVALDEKEGREMPFEKRRFLAPQLLPQERPDSKVLLAFDNATKAFFYRFDYELLHEGILQRLIVRLFRLNVRVEEAWRNGILLQSLEQDGIALVEMLSGQSSILISLKEGSRYALLEKILHELREVQEGEGGIVPSVSLDNKAYIRLEDLKKWQPGEQVMMSDDTRVPYEQLEIFLRPPSEQLTFKRMETPERPDAGPKNPPTAKDAFKYFRKLIAGEDWDNLFKLLETALSDTDWLGELIGHQGRRTRLNNNVRDGRLTAEEEERQRSEFSVKMRDFLKEVEDDSRSNPALADRLAGVAERLPALPPQEPDHTPLDFRHRPASAVPSTTQVNITVSPTFSHIGGNAIQQVSQQQGTQVEICKELGAALPDLKGLLQEVLEDFLQDDASLEGKAAKSNITRLLASIDALAKQAEEGNQAAIKAQKREFWDRLGKIYKECKSLVGTALTPSTLDDIKQSVVKMAKYGKLLGIDIDLPGADGLLEG